MHQEPPILRRHRLITTGTAASAPPTRSICHQKVGATWSAQAADTHDVSTADMQQAIQEAGEAFITEAASTLQSLARKFPQAPARRPVTEQLSKAAHSLR